MFDIKKFLPLVISVSTYLLFTSIAFGITIPNTLPGDFLSNFTRLTNLIRPVVVLVFLGVFFYGGFTLMTASDSAEKLQKGWQTLAFAAVGLIVIFLAPSVVDLIGQIFGVELIEFL
ncbi:hypothetical protein KC717_05840 [Candidatus Dojkabacteria bacterium]|uniref:TrbC/VirB2 family protein n=1 Tax=Candidatus Dojkabacteria bacterium TaxID=2099670 RepID=A0A955RL99_9BACT|nr:hypothetical protein [Candidatus Dojkabacteria bacterium]